ncbi:AraC family transcriptional regulator [Actinoplanes cyaneus]|uniref:AraC family transcriptional regulator n=1 Tax=Actinoplanes cyaneus TaxID=52696 RepID=A0A919IRH4_9ACTN|nr:AraC family transcriptional regulator [Actinoplanes cyaneus]MCW2141715.1 transcriptional regulator, AraC family [Actinoplanes cyaneus]GID68203.1 AraC family transcriptional regulator [Actinoplanes cyaneus]
MDPLEDVLALVDASSYVSAGLRAGGDWAVRFEAPAGVKFNSVRRGNCLIRVDGVGAPIRLEPGDAFLLTRPAAFVMASDLTLAAVSAHTIFAAATDGVAQAGTGDDVEVIGGGLLFNERARTLLLAHLPPVMHVPAATAQADNIAWVLHHIAVEAQQPRIGASVIAKHLAMVLFVEVLRLHLARSPQDVSGWLAGSVDPVVGPALQAIHGRPERGWTVAGLAQISRVSRSTLAARFKTIVGTGPLDYLTGWRIQLASQRLSRTTETLDTISRRVGYASESALSTAFKRVTGLTPREYRKQHTVIRAAM